MSLRGRFGLDGPAPDRRASPDHGSASDGLPVATENSATAPKAPASSTGSSSAQVSVGRLPGDCHPPLVPFEAPRTSVRHTRVDLRDPVIDHDELLLVSDDGRVDVHQSLAGLPCRLEHWECLGIPCRARSGHPQ